MARTKTPEQQRVLDLMTASMQCAKAGDRAGAKAALDPCIELLVAMRPPAQKWRDLANHYVVDAEDMIAARKVLALGITTMEPTSADELCVFSLGYVRALDDEMARTVLMRAEALATPADWEALFKVNATLFNLRRAEQIIDEQLAAANTLQACQSLAQLVNRWDTWKSGDTDEPTERWGGSLQRVVLAKMEHLATQTNNKPELLAKNWCDVAYCYKHVLGAKAIDDIRRCLHLAAQHLYADGMRATVAQRLRYWAHEPGMADTIWPWTPVSEALKKAPYGESLDGWTPEPVRLFDWLRAQLSDDAIQALAGHSAFLADEEKQTIIDIRDTGRLPLPWQVAIARRVYEEETNVGTLGRAFACTLECLGSGLRQRLPDLVESCVVLGPDALDGAIGLLAARQEAASNWNNEPAYVRLAMLLAGAARDPEDSRLVPLATRVVADHAAKALDLENRAWARLIDGVLAPHDRFAPLVSALRP